MPPGPLRIALASAWLNGLHAVSPERATGQALSLFCTPQGRNPPAEADLPLLQEAEVSRLVLPSSQVGVAVYRWPVSTGQVGRVLLAHGWESCVGRLAAWVTPLRGAGYEVVGVDAPAHGASEGRRLTVHDYMEALHAVVGQDTLEAVVAHSFGGLCAALAAGGLASSRSLPVRSLVLIAAPENVALLLNRFAELLRLRPVLSGRLAAAVQDLSGEALERFSAAAALASGDLPVLLVHDTRDEQVPFAQAERLAERVRHAELYPTTGLGHRRVARNPHVIRYAIDFIRRAS
jgi:pimeloyl-ACP methyl ester carboxylesterase